MNSRVRLNNVLNFKGVSFMKQKRKWRAYITKNSKFIHLGLFMNAKQAAQAYNKAAKKLFSEFALLNKI